VKEQEKELVWHLGDYIQCDLFKFAKMRGRKRIENQFLKHNIGG